MKQWGNDTRPVTNLTTHFCLIEIVFERADVGHHLPALYTACVEYPAGSFGGICTCIFTGEVDNLFDGFIAG